jgi:hypothetical protein
MITSLGFERNSHEIASPKFAAAVKNLGIEAVVLWMSGTSVNPNDGIWDFHSVNACWHAFNDAGLKIILKRMWAPPQATDEDGITYQPYTYGAQSWNLDANGNAIPGSAHFDPERACVKDPAHIRADWCTEFSGRLDTLYFKPGYCDHFISWNEPADGNYWPPVASRPFDEAYDRVWNEVYRPSAILNFDPNDPAKRVPPWMIGPDAAYDDDLNRLLEKDAAEHTFDVISFHGYSSDGTLDGALSVLESRTKIIDKYRNGREVWNTEMGDGGAGWLVDYMKKAPSIMPYLGFINIANAALLFTQESIDNETYKLTQTGKELKQFLSQ